MSEEKPGGERLVYLVRETISTTNLDELRPDEARKIRCRKRHFKDALGVGYEKIASVAELSNKAIVQRI